jgi:hypothetical protein
MRFVNDADYSASVQAQSVEISQNITDRVSTAKITFISQAGGAARYDEAHYDADVYSIDVRELYEIRIEEYGTGTRQFAGTIRQIKPTRKNRNTVYLECDCLDYTTVLDEAYIDSATFSGQTDRAIIQALINTYAPTLTALTANISNLTTVPEYTIKEKTLRQALDELVEITGGEYRVDYSKGFRYFSAAAAPAAPFGFSNKPNYGTTFPIDALASYNRDAIRIINRCTVLGAVQPGGARLKVVYNDPISQASYGVRPITVVDDQMTVGTVASLRAKSIVDENAYPQESLSFTTHKDGLQVGMLLPVEHTSYLVSGSYIIRELTIKQVTRTLTEYSLSLGARVPDSVRLLQQIDARSRRETSSPVAVPANGTVTDASVALGGLSSTSITSVNAAAIIGLINAGQINTVNATAIQGVITAGQVGSINAAVIQGVIVSNQVADDLINRLALFNNALRPIPNLASDPALPDVNYPEGAVYFNTTSSNFRKVVSGAWSTVTESTAVTGKLEYYHIGTIKAGSIIGLIAAGQIGSITAGQITGQLSAAQIAAVNASAISGTITASQIASVNATSIAGTLTASQIASVSATTITGTVSASQIGSVNASSITIGLIQNGQIQSVSASKLSAGTIDASVITVINLDASSITTGTFSANRIGAGTISASVTLTSPTLVISSGGTTVNIDATNKIKVSESAFNRNTEMTGSHFRVGSISDSANFAELALGVLTVAGPGGVNVASLISTSLQFQFQQVVGTRKTGWSIPSGTSTRTGFNTATATTQQVAEALRALIQDLHGSAGHGLIGF